MSRLSDLSPLKVSFQMPRAVREGRAEHSDVEVEVDCQQAFQRYDDLHGHALHLQQGIHRHQTLPRYHNATSGSKGSERVALGVG